MPAPTLLQERFTAIKAAASLLSSVEGGRSGVLFVVGEAGLGKTSLVEQVCRMAQGRVQVGVARGHPMDTALAFGLFSQLLGRVGGQDVLAADEAVVMPRPARLDATLRWVSRPAVGPLLLVLDDLHWADPDSLVLLSFLCRRLAGHPVGFLATLRPWPPAAHDVAVDLVENGSGVVTALAPLSRAAAGVLLAERTSRSLPAEMVERAWRVCGGNPLLLEQIAVAIDRGEQVPEHRPGGAPMPSLEIVLARFAGLPPAGLRCARAAAVLGPSFLPGLAVEVAQLVEDEVDEALDAMGRSGLVRTATAGGTEFVHPLFAQALYRDLSEPLRIRLHVRAFRVLAARGRDQDAAEHAVRAELVGDPTAVDLLERVGRAARRAGAVASAADRLCAAARLAGDRGTPTLLLTMSETLLDAGRPAEAITTLEDLARRPDSSTPDRVEALRMLGRALTFTGAYDRARSCLQEAATLAEVHDPAIAVEVLLDHAVNSWFGTGPGAALPSITRARVIAGELPGGPHRRAESAWTTMAFQAGDPTAVNRLTAEIDSLQDALHAEVADLAGVFGQLHNTAITAILAERCADAEHLLAMGRAIAARRGATAAAAGLAPLHARALAYLGHLDAAAQAIDETLGYAELMPMLQLYGCVGAACIAHYQGRLEQSTAWCDRLEVLAPGQDLVLMYVREIRAQRDLRDGRLEEAAEAYRRIEETAQRIAVGEPCLVYWARHAVTAYVGCGRFKEALRVVDWLAERSSVLPCRWPRIALATCQATLADANGDNVLAERGLRAALAHHNEVDLPVEEIETLLDLASFLRRTGRPTEARPLLKRALELVDRTGARWFTDPLQEELTLAGGRRRRPREYPDRLTAAEARVVRIVATGRSNRQVAAQLSLSVHTVESHLDRIYTKLGVHSRGELIARRATGASDPEGPPK